jgi:hypothetical protein
MFTAGSVRTLLFGMRACFTVTWTEMHPPGVLIVTLPRTPLNAAYLHPPQLLLVLLQCLVVVWLMVGIADCGKLSPKCVEHDVLRWQCAWRLLTRVSCETQGTGNH